MSKWTQRGPLHLRIKRKLAGLSKFVIIGFLSEKTTEKTSTCRYAMGVSISNIQPRIANEATRAKWWEIRSQSGNRGLAESRYPSVPPTCIPYICIRSIGSSTRQDNALEKDHVSESLKINTVKFTCYSIKSRASAVRCKLVAACAIVAGTLVAAIDVFWVIGACTGDVRPPAAVQLLVETQIPARPVQRPLTAA